MKPNYFHLQAIALLIAVLFQSCKKFTDVEPGSDLIQSEDVFVTESQVVSAMSGVYTSLRGNNFFMLNGGMSLYTGLSSDELYATSPTTTTDPFYLNELLANNATLNNSFYSHSYKTIYQANAIIEGVEKSITLAENTKRNFIGEMKFVRALIYFNLVNLFGNIPLITSTQFEINASFPRTARDEIFRQIISDLKNSELDLKTSYPSIGKARPNKLAASLLLARAYLYLSDWSNAALQASKVINAGVYVLVPVSNIGNVFLKGSTETVWEIASPNELSPTGDGSFFNPSSTSTRPAYAMTNSLLSSFEIGDQRKSNLTGKNTISSIDYWYPRKYKQRSIPSGSSPTEYQVVLRLAEAYLIRSEANARLNEFSLSLSDLNIIRTRAGLGPKSFASADQLLSEIEKEWQTEFFCEQGHRWLDLKRWDKANQLLLLLKPSTWQATDTLWPIPESELISNPYLTQNPGYKMENP